MKKIPLSPNPKKIRRNTFTAGTIKNMSADKHPCPPTKHNIILFEVCGRGSRKPLQDYACRPAS